VTSNAILRRIELLERAVTEQRHPKFVLCWTNKLAERIQSALGPGYTTISIRGLTGCADDEAFESKLREDPAESERLNNLLAGIPPD
jgi:hypothetical protein